MKFLIDECLHTSLVTLARDAGHVCEHVNFLGLGGQKDWQLMTRIRRDDYTFVTNNRTDFTAHDDTNCKCHTIVSLAQGALQVATKPLAA